MFAAGQTMLLSVMAHGSNSGEHRYLCCPNVGFAIAVHSELADLAVQLEKPTSRQQDAFSRRTSVPVLRSQRPLCWKSQGDEN